MSADDGADEGEEDENVYVVVGGGNDDAISLLGGKWV